MRHMLSVPVLAASLILANPVAAKDRAPDSELLEKFNDPEFQDGLANMMSGFMIAMMDLPIGQLAAGVERAIPDDMKKRGGLSNIDPDATIGDLARRDNPDFDRNMENKMRKSTEIMGIMASEFGAMLPQLRAMGDKMKRRIEDLD